MIALLASIVLGAFPIQGSMVRSLDSVLVIDGDTVTVSHMQCGNMCTCSERVVTIGAAPNPNTTHVDGRQSGTVRLGGKHSDYQSMNGMVVVCSQVTVTMAPDSTRRFILKGKNHNWLIKADSLAPLSTPPLAFNARWSWKRFDSEIIPSDMESARRAPARLDLQAWDLATGQSITLPRPMQTGRHLLDGPSGTRIIVVR